MFLPFSTLTRFLSHIVIVMAIVAMLTMDHGFGTFRVHDGIAIVRVKSE